MFLEALMMVMMITLMMTVMIMMMVTMTKNEMYLGVVQDTPVLVRVAFVISTCNQWCCDSQFMREKKTNLTMREHMIKTAQG